MSRGEQRVAAVDALHGAVDGRADLAGDPDFFATTLMSNGFEPQDVQKALRHANLRITLETYVHWLPKKDRPRGVVGQLLRQADGRRSDARNGQDRS